MSEIIVIAYSDINRAREVLDAMRQLNKTDSLDLEDAVCVSKDKNEKVHVQQSKPQGRRGALTGGAVGLVAGILFLNPLVGAGVGALVGGLAGRKHDVGIDDAFAKQVSAQLKPESSAIVMLARQDNPDAVIAELARHGGVVLKTSVSPEVEARLQAALEAPSETPQDAPQDAPPAA